MRDAGQAGALARITSRWAGAALGAAALTAAIALPGPPAGAQVDEAGTGTCAPLDVAIVLDTTTSMNAAIENVKANIAAFTERVETESDGDYRIALVDFGTDVAVHETFAPNNAVAIRAALPDLAQRRANAMDPEAWDEALVAVVDTRPAAGIGVDPQTGQPWEGAQFGDFDTPFRPEAKKLVVLVTDARPGGFDDHYDKSDLDRAYGAALRAAEAGIRVATVFVPNGSHEPDAAAHLQRVANLTGSSYFASAADGANVTDSLDLAVTTCAADTDSDGLFDSWETDGFDADGDGIIDVDLPAMGADPGRADLFVQVNWMQPDGARPCYLLVYCPGGADGAHPPDPLALDRIVDVFAGAPVENPDGSTGITVHVDAGALTPPGGLAERFRQGGPTFEHRDVWLRDDAGTDVEQAATDTAALVGDRAATTTLVHYTHTIDGSSGLLGYAPGLPGDIVLVAGAHMTSTFQEAATVVHELGHTLGLRHGGLDDENAKPNYHSIMNYDAVFQGGLVRNGTGGLIDFSGAELAALDEDALDEPAGIVAVDEPFPPKASGWRRCPEETDPVLVPFGVPVDWNCDGDTADTGVEAGVRGPGVGYRVTLTGRDDWATLTFTGGERGGLASAGEPLDEDGFTYEAWLTTPKAHALVVDGPTIVSSPAAATLRLPIRLANIGTDADTYQVAATAAGDWDTPLVAPAQVRVPAGEQTTVGVDVPVPADAAAGDTLTVVVEVVSDTVAHVSAAHVVAVEVGPGARDVTAGPLRIAPASPTTGTDFEVTATGFDPGQRVLVTAPAGTVPAQEVEADGTGAIAATFTAPDEPGPVELVAVAVADPADTTPVDVQDLLDPPSGDEPADPANREHDEDGDGAGGPELRRGTVDVAAPPEPADPHRQPVPPPDTDTGGFPFVPLGAVTAALVAAGVVWWRRRSRTADT